ncbi:MAG: hydrogenase maturation protease [Pseudomonadota bacterium]
MTGEPAPTLVIGIGNPSRGDDALGPLLLKGLASLALPGVELLEDYQLQVEFLLDLDGRERVVFVDASVAGDAPFRFSHAGPLPDAGYTSHALAPEVVLAAYARHFGRPPPPAWILGIRAYGFELGDDLSPEAAANLAAAQEFLTGWLVRQRVP